MDSLVCAQQLPACGSLKYGMPPRIFMNTPILIRAACAMSDPIIFVLVSAQIVPGAPGYDFNSWSSVAVEIRFRDMTVSARGASPSLERTSFLRASLRDSQMKDFNTTNHSLAGIDVSSKHHGLHCEFSILHSGFLAGCRFFALRVSVNDGTWSTFEFLELLTQVSRV